jgi:RimJ/RimL family protein N-acetyltransferase
MNVVNADAVLKNTRSQHVLEKLGFERTGEDEAFVHYRMKNEDWKENLQR